MACSYCGCLAHRGRLGARRARPAVPPPWPWYGDEIQASAEIQPLADEFQQGRRTGHRSEHRGVLALHLWSVAVAIQKSLNLVSRPCTDPRSLCTNR